MNDTTQAGGIFVSLRCFAFSYGDTLGVFFVQRVSQSVICINFMQFIAELLGCLRMNGICFL
ncbi:MAG: hypothetical protein ACTMIA_14040 [Vibrio sp.]